MHPLCISPSLFGLVPVTPSVWKPLCPCLYFSVHLAVSGYVDAVCAVLCLLSLSMWIL